MGVLAAGRGGGLGTQLWQAAMAGAAEVRDAELQSAPGRHVRARPPPAHCRSYPKVVGSVFHWLHAVPLVPGVSLARAAQQLLVVEAEEAELATV